MLFVGIGSFYIKYRLFLHILYTYLSKTKKATKIKRKFKIQYDLN